MSRAIGILMVLLGIALLLSGNCILLFWVVTLAAFISEDSSVLSDLGMAAVFVGTALVGITLTGAGVWLIWHRATRSRSPGF